MTEKKSETLADNLTSAGNYQPSKEDEQAKKLDFDKLKLTIIEGQ